MDLLQHLWTGFLRVGHDVLDVLESGSGYLELEEKLHQAFNELACNILKSVLEAADAKLREKAAERPGWVVQRRNESKAVGTPFGLLAFERTYFKHKETKEYAYLVDRMAGLEPHCRLDTAAKAQLVEAAAEQSYRKSGAKLEVSGQAVPGAVREFCGEDFGGRRTVAKQPKRHCRFLYVEADEDHVASQQGRTMEIPLVYVHEGATGSARRRLKRARYFAGPYASTEDLWLDVWEYIDTCYDVDEIELIFVAGDGAGWVRAGARIIPKSVFVLDRFHLRKSVTGAVGANVDWQKRIREALRHCDRKAVNAVLNEALADAETPARRKAILDCQKYIRNNWDGIEAYKKYAGKVLGCSAEGHVSHVLSARLSSRPSGWSKLGAGQMAQLRAMQANGEKIRGVYLTNKRAHSVGLLTVCRKAIAEQRKKLQLPWPQQLGNLPALSGPTTPLTRVLRAVAFSA